MNKKVRNKLLSKSELNKQLSTSLFEMTDISGAATGLGNVIIWIAPILPNQNKRIHVSNVPSKSYAGDTFTITIPDLEIIGDVNRSFIDGQKLEQIRAWVVLNQKAIEDYEEGNLLTDEFIFQLKK